MRIHRLTAFLLMSSYLLLSFIWVIPGTIAVRNILLGLALIISIVFLSTQKKQLVNVLNGPLLMLLGLLVWVAIHFFFFSLNVDIELKEIKSLWIRVIGCICIAIALGLIVKKSSWYRIFFAVALSMTPLINLGVYLYQSYRLDALIIPHQFVSRFLFNKIEAAFFGSIAIAIFLAYLFHNLKKRASLTNKIAIFLLFVACTLFALSSVVSASKNGVLISLGLLILFAICTLMLSFHKKNGAKRYIVPALLIFLLSIVLIKSHKTTSTPGWDSLIADIKVSLQIDNYQHWKKTTEPHFPPNEHGQVVAGNTYERVAWAVVGWRLIMREPLGYGSINNSFKGMLDHQQIKHNIPGQTHSGWTDFALAFGIPGLLILISTQLAIIYRGLKHKNRFSLIGVWICVALLPMGVFAEICYKQYFEATIFFIAFAAVMVAPPHQSTNRYL